MEEIDYSNEVWKDIPDYEGCYQVSDLGRVKNLRRQVSHTSKYWHEVTEKTISERILKPQTDKGGYQHVRLSRDGEIKLFKVHTLVAMAFMDYDPTDFDIEDAMSLCVVHINEDRSDNRLINLEIVPRLEVILKSKGKM